MAQWWRTALGAGREPSADQEAAIVAPSTGRHTVNAGAGTGKTSTLALRALFLIESGRARADEIVVVTFTKKAAAEIGSRIADTLDRAIENGARLTAGRGVSCTTIHALAAHILREFAFDFGAPAPTRAVSDGEAYAIFHEAFRALLDGRLAVDTRAFPIAELQLDSLERDLGKLALRLKNHAVAPRTFESRALAAADRLGEQTWGQLWTAGSGRNRAKPKEKRPKREVTADERRLEAARERANIRVVCALFEEFDRRLDAHAAATYGDLLGIATRQLRERPDVVERLRLRWRYVMLDESQDSSDLQLDFIETLFGRPGESGAAGMMPVGDSRQAIYGFNGAGEGVMERLASISAVTHSLVVNRRSPHEIVDAGHAVLERAGIVDPGAGVLQAAAGSAGLACVRVQNFGEDGESIRENVEREAAGIAREVRRLLRDPATAPSDIAILVRRRTHAAAYVRALNEQGIAAALDRRSGLFVADEVRDALAWMSLLLNLRDRQAIVRILQSPVCGLSDAAMIGLAHGEHWTDAFLRDGFDQRLDADTRARLANVRALLTSLLPAVALPLPAAIARILSEAPIAASYAAFGNSIGAQAIVNLRSLDVLAREFAAERPGSRLGDFVADARRRIRYDDDPQEAELDLDGVRVLTIHQAKGLEWPFVFVACSTKSQYGNADPTEAVVKYDLRAGVFALKNDIDGRETFRWLTRTGEHDPNTGERTGDAESARAAREQARVFYVALTRAKRRVYVTAPVPVTEKGEAPYLSSIREWAESLEPGVDLRFDVPPAADAKPVAPRETQATRLVAERVTPAPKAAPSTFRPRVSFTAISAFETCPRSARLRYRLLLPNLRDARSRFVGLDSAEGPGPANAARLGSLAHRALELWGRGVIEGRAIALAGAFASAALEFADATAHEADRALASAQRAVEALSGYDVLEVEAPFEIAFARTRVEGVVDLIARDPGGRLLVIDYKTGRTGDEHYTLQTALYRRVARERYPDDRVDGAILRLTPDNAILSIGKAMADDELDRAISAVGLFESDVARVGAWCDFCPYRGSPCMAPLGQAV
jgi:DNA helicase-2/ATP-dependent DNA helicase PcrA